MPLDRVKVKGERSFSDYKRMHWVVCKTILRKSLREIFERG